MTRDQLLRLLRKECKARGWTLEVDTRLGKGSHYRVMVNGRITTIKSGEMSPQYVKLVRAQLGL
ncbi:hypothetical protein VE25_07135 [Devosia geojensis]|uniref:Type II toxin-antitoxin system HicA family toxin n=1 Tax=Devosia geojensis TaxID=443610 RepID=A0A0F5FUC4_9HYPH|nr:hypothetical protein [Devosia geojensis]KKB12471.1 hypothetical protein VE25_07135 [Devosia geojensis]